MAMKLGLMQLHAYATASFRQHGALEMLDMYDHAAHSSLSEAQVAAGYSCWLSFHMACLWKV